MKKVIDDNEELKRQARKMPHGNLIVENGSITIPSIFMFGGGPEEFYAFLYCCDILNCTLILDNEGMRFEPKGNSKNDFEVYKRNVVTNVNTVIYMALAMNPKYVDDYNRYKENIDKMKWPEPVV